MVGVVGGEGEGSRYVVDLWFAAGRKQHLDDIHAAGNLASQPLQPQAGHAAQQVSFVFIDSPRGAPGGTVQSTFHLYKYKQVLLPAYDVHFPIGIDPEAPSQYLIPLCPEPGKGNPFSVFSQIRVLRRLVFTPGAVPVV